MLPKVSRTKFDQLLKSRSNEDLDIIVDIESTLKKKRGYVFRMPAKGESVILLLSGGLDSISAWGILMQEFGLHVYPISFDRSEPRAPRERAAIHYFSKYYAGKFPKLFHEPIRINLGLDQISINSKQNSDQVHPAFILEKFSRLKNNNFNSKFFTSEQALLPIYGKQYAEFLHATQNLNINTIFNAVLPTDGLISDFQRFTALRESMFNLCVNSGDFKWQFTSLFFEKETQLLLEKSAIIRWAVTQQLPIEHTWSCYLAGKYQCGADCIACYARKKAFGEAGVIDKTIYRTVYYQNITQKIWHKFRNVFSGILDK